MHLLSQPFDYSFDAQSIRMASSGYGTTEKMFMINFTWVWKLPCVESQTYR